MFAVFQNGIVSSPWVSVTRKSIVTYVSQKMLCRFNIVDFHSALLKNSDLLVN